MSRNYDCLIIGGGHAGAQAAISLRKSKFTGSIGLLSSEADLPYERPPLSKDYLLGPKSIEEIRLRPPQFWVERSIDIHLGITWTASTRPLISSSALTGAASLTVVRSGPQVGCREH